MVRGHRGPVPLTGVTLDEEAEIQERLERPGKAVPFPAVKREVQELVIRMEDPGSEPAQIGLGQPPAHEIPAFGRQAGE